MRILHISDYYQPALGYQEVFLPREHARLGHDVSVITSDRYYPFPYYEETVGPLLGPRQLAAGEYHANGVGVYRLEARLEYRTRVWLKGLPDMIERLVPDVIYAHGISSLTSVRVAWWKLRSRSKCRLVYDCHMTRTASTSKLRWLFLGVYRHLIKHSVLNAGDHFVAVAVAAKRYMETAYGIPSCRIQMIPLGADTDCFRRQPAERERTRAELGIDRGEVVYIYVGKVLPGKGIHLLAEAAKRLLKECSNSGLRILVVGGGPSTYRRHIERDLRTAGIEGSFIWTGVVPNAELPRYYSAADIGVWPGEVSITQWEAMSCELPIIVADNPAAAERVSWGNGLVCREGDAEDLYRAMRELLTNKDAREEMGRIGRRIAEEEVSWKVIAVRFLELASARS
jgi:glycosyltransferase involved in cell wall biosynthesis